MKTIETDTTIRRKEKTFKMLSKYEKGRTVNKNDLYFLRDLAIAGIVNIGVSETFCTITPLGKALLKTQKRIQSPLKWFWKIMSEELGF